MMLADVAQLIIRHAETGPSETPGERVRNRLSPSMESFITETIRGYLIRQTQLAKQQVAAELATLPDENAAVIAARINEILQNIYK